MKKNEIMGLLKISKNFQLILRVQLKIGTILVINPCLLSTDENVGRAVNNGLKDQ